MRNRCLINLLLIIVVTQVSFESLTIADDAAPNAETPKPPLGFMFIEEEQWNLMADEPNRHIGQAREAFLMTDAQTAANELRKAAIHVRIAASHASERTKKSLVYSEHELERTARRIEHGTLKSVEEFDLASARALHAMADYQYLKAAEAWRKRETRLSAQYLRAATDNLERMAARTDARLKTATADVAKESRLISSKLMNGTKVAVDEVADGIEKVGHQIEHVGARFAPVSGDK